jgi:hypothetical protein
MNSINRLLSQHVERAKSSKGYQEKPLYIKPKTNTEIITTEYKKQKVDKKDHLEMEEKMKPEPAPRVKKASGLSTLKKQMSKDMKTAGSRNIGKPVEVRGSVPLKPVNAEVQSTFGLGKPNRMSARANKVKEIMKSKKMSLAEASKYIKENNIKY